MTKVLFSAQIDKYTEAFTTPESPALAALNRETNMKVDKAVMLSGHIQGALLQMISHAVRPVKILEIGTFTGYSAICLAQGLQPGGVVHTIDIDEETEEITSRYFEKAGLKDSIIQHTGRATDIIPGIGGPFDIVFIDADKTGYGQYFDLVIDKMRPGGFILADNVLYEGEVLLPDDEQSKNARAIHSFNQKIKADDRVEQLLLPVRDGIMMIRKK